MFTYAKKYITSMPETSQTTSRRKQTAKIKYNTLIIINPFTKSQVYIIYFIQTSSLNSIYEILTF